MRKHKYKAKRLDGQWVKGYYFAKPILNLHFILEGENQWMIDSNTLCEFTEHRDSHKQNIYQNDIVAFWIGNKISCNYNYQTFCLRLQDPWGDYSKIEVIGNIFDNPELLEANNV